MPVDVRKKRNSIHIALEEVDFIWSRDEVEAFRLMWNDGKSLVVMSKFFKRDPDEVALLAMDQMKRGTIKQRRGGVLGG